MSLGAAALRRVAIALLIVGQGTLVFAAPRWTPAQAREWYTGRGFSGRRQLRAGTRHQPARDVAGRDVRPRAIDRELGWAEGIGFNSMRVFLHHLLWEQDAEGLLQRHGPVPGNRGQAPDRRDVRAVRQRLGPVPAARASSAPPRPRVHNSGWVQSPGEVALEDPGRWRSKPTSGGRRPLQGRPAGLGVGPLQRGRQHERPELRQRGSRRTRPSWRSPCCRRSSPGPRGDPSSR